MRALMIVAALAAGPAHAASLKPMTTLHEGVVHLADLFDDAGPQAARVLGPGPAPGGRIVVESAQLAAIARQFGVDWRPSSEADRAVLERAGRPIPRAPVLDALRAALVATGATSDCDLEIEAFAPPLVPVDGAAEPVVTQLDWDRPSGRFTALLSVTAPAMEPLNLRIAGRALDTMELAVATRRVIPGEVLRAEDFRLARVPVSQVRGEMLTVPAQGAGMSARHGLGPGQAVAVADLFRPAAVQRREQVLVELDTPGMQLTAEGQAMDQGAVGDRIRILNPVSRAVVEAEVLGQGRVRVLPGSLPLTSADRAAQAGLP